MYRVVLTVVSITAFSFMTHTLIVAAPVHAQTAQPDAAQAAAIRRAALESQLAALEKEIDNQRSILEVKKNQRVSLERDIAILTAEIKQAKLAIQARNLQIEKLAEDIKDKEKTIGVLTDKIEDEKQSMADLMQRAQEFDNSSLAEGLLAGKTLSDFFQNVSEYHAIQEALRTSYLQVASDRTETQKQRDDLADKKQEQTDLLAIQQLQKKRLDQQEAEKKKILSLTKGIEADYQKLLKSKELSAASIRAELFTLQGSAAIPFEKALEYAKRASIKTGVRPAFILGILAEESNLGQNVGTGTWRVDMKAPRDTVPFQDITSRLGLNPDKMPVSKKAWYGWGGAMGPAQFIPSTWILYEKKIADATGKSVPNPWDPEDAIMACAILSKENGAAGAWPNATAALKASYSSQTSKTRAAERLAALRYLAGWTNATKSAYAFYGDDVMQLADKYQKQIDILGGF